MAKKSLGYVELEWTCPNCQTRNPGPQKTCLSCGLPQPEDVTFEQPAEEKIITDEAEIAQAKAGPDIHCYYCGSRNPAGAERCSQCGALLSEGTARTSGQVLGAHRTEPAEPVLCPACGTPNPPDAAKCGQCGASLPRVETAPPPPAKPQTAPAKKRSRFGIYAGLAVLLLICGACITYFVLFNQTEETIGRVQAVSWTREVVVEELLPVSDEGWREEIPAEAIIGVCTEKVHHRETRPTGQTREVCGTPYTVDQGSGYGEVVQDCETEQITEEVPIYAEFCEYTVDEWQEVDRLSASGTDALAIWPEINLGQRQREGPREQSYEIVFETEQGTYTYTTGNEKEFAQAKIGSRWVLQINTFNVVTDVEPVR
jgi:ribosomal protein L40E